MIRLKNLLKQSKRVKWLFEQTVSTKIKSWFDSNKPNTVQNFKAIGAGVGGGLILPLKSRDWGTYGAGIQLCIDQMLSKYKVNSFLTNGEPNTKVTNKKGQWDTVVDKIPIKIQGGGQIVTSIDPKLAGSVNSWSTPDRFVPASIYERLQSINAFNVSQWSNGTQITNIAPAQVASGELGTKNIKLSQSILRNKQNNGLLFRNNLETGKLNQQLVIFSPYAQSFQKGITGTPDVMIPAKEIDPMDFDNAFITAHYELNPAKETKIIETIENLKKAIESTKLGLAGIPQIIIKAGTDQERISEKTKTKRGIKNNKDLANRRANSIKKLLVAQGFPAQVITIDLSGVDGGPPQYTFQGNETDAQKQAIMNQWRLANAQYRFVTLDFPGLKIPGKIIPGGETTFDRFVQSRTLDSGDVRSLTSDAFIYRLTLNLIKP